MKSVEEHHTTADGKLVTAGDGPFWIIDERGTIHETNTALSHNIRGLPRLSAWVEYTIPECNTNGWTYTIECCYSTKELAEKELERMKL